MPEPPRLIFKRPSEKWTSTFHTSMAKDSSDSMRLRWDLAPHHNSTKTSRMARITKWHELNSGNNRHWFNYVDYNEMGTIFSDAGEWNAKSKLACENVLAACPISASTGRPAERRKVSITHVNEAFNEEVKANFLYVWIHEEKQGIINIIDVGTKYGEREILCSRSGEGLRESSRKMWSHMCRALKYFSADHEFCRAMLQKFMENHGKEARARPSRSSHKTGKIERNKGIFKAMYRYLTRRIGSHHLLRYYQEPLV